ncbi:MAG: phage virion morphogenesis protein [Treponema sp.]|nr:phage virion morphogenesis protein [Treponema sp.]MBQ6780277.1 phage virion morphogenesis protein [Treponema sp.]
MGVQITKRAGEIAKRLKNGNLAPTMRRVSKYLVSSAIGKINKGVSPENAPLTKEVKQGDKTLRDNGQLMASIAPQNGNDWALAQTNLAYAKINQEGGTISGKGKGLWLPASAETRRLMRKYNAQKPGELIEAMKGDGYSFFRRGKVFCAKKKKGKPFAVFIIKQQVKIPARPFLYIDESDEKHINKEIKKAVHEALKGDGKK